MRVICTKVQNIINFLGTRNEKNLYTHLAGFDENCTCHCKLCDCSCFGKEYVASDTCCHKHLYVLNVPRSLIDYYRRTGRKNDKKVQGIHFLLVVLR